MPYLLYRRTRGRSNKR